MGGFPARPSLSAFGPNLQNNGVVRNPNSHLGADFFNLLKWQVAGCGLVVAKAVIYAKVTPGSTSVVTVSQAFPWDADGELPLTTWVYGSAGLYFWTLPASTFSDQSGNSVGPGFLAGQVLPCKTSSADNLLVGQVQITSASEGAIVFEENGGGAENPVGSGGTEGNFLLVLW